MDGGHKKKATEVAQIALRALIPGIQLCLRLCESFQMK
jgi:hypothetical protein